MKEKVMSILSSIIANIEAWFRPEMTPKQKADALDRRASSAGEHLDWRHSVEDLMKLAGMDSSMSARVELAKELGYPKVFVGNTEQNIWLHAQVMNHLKLIA
jgi:hypothetical protein